MPGLVMPSLSPEQLAIYRASAQKRQQAHHQRKLERQQGWQVARQAAHLLKQEFNATRVILFGSMVELRRVHLESDIDIAVEGLADERYLTAVAALLDLSAFFVDLVQLEHVPPEIRAAIAQQGIVL